MRDAREPIAPAGGDDDANVGVESTLQLGDPPLVGTCQEAFSRKQRPPVEDAITSFEPGNPGESCCPVERARRRDDRDAVAGPEGRGE